MKTITIQELIQEMKSNNSNLKLINALQPTLFQKMHIPNSLNFAEWNNIETSISKEDEVVVYCTNNLCYRSRALYSILKAMGYQNLKRFSGGLQEWDLLGLKMNNSMSQQLAA